MADKESPRTKAPSRKGSGGSDKPAAEEIAPVDALFGGMHRVRISAAEVGDPAEVAAHLRKLGVVLSPEDIEKANEAEPGLRKTAESNPDLLAEAIEGKAELPAGANWAPLLTDLPENFVARFAGPSAADRTAAQELFRQLMEWAAQSAGNAAEFTSKPLTSARSVGAGHPRAAVDLVVEALQRVGLRDGINLLATLPDAVILAERLRNAGEFGGPHANP